MAKPKTIDKHIEETEYNLAKLKCVSETFPDAKIRQGFLGPEFLSKSVNSKYTDLDFVKQRNYALYVQPYYSLPFTFNGKAEVIKVHSSPFRSRLAYVRYYNKSINFSRLTFNIKNNNFNDAMLNECYVQIASFIKENNGFKLDTKHLSPKIKNLLSFV